MFSTILISTAILKLKKIVLGLLFIVFEICINNKIEYIERKNFFVFLSMFNVYDFITMIIAGICAT